MRRGGCQLAKAARVWAETSGSASLFWDDVPSLVRTQAVAWRNVTGYRQITDLQLLSLAVAHDAAFTTFDQRVSLRAVHGAEPRHLRVL